MYLIIVNNFLAYIFIVEFDTLNSLRNKKCYNIMFINSKN